MLAKSFWINVVDRCLKTIAQSLLSVWAVGGGLDLFHADWKTALSIALGAGVLSVLTSFASISVPGVVLGAPSAARGKHEQDQDSE